MNVLLIKTVLALGFGAVMPLVWYLHDSSHTMSFLRSRKILLVATCASRLVPYVAIYLLYGYSPQSDVSGAYFPWAIAAAQGQVVYRDFANDYGPLFPYVLGIAVRVWHDPRSIVLLMMVIELFTLTGSYRFFQPDMGQDQRLKASLLYLLSPAPFILVLLGGTQNDWLWTAALFLIWLALRNEWFVAGLSAGIGLLFTKAYLLLYMIPLIMSSRKPFRYIGGIGAIAMLSFPPLWLLVGTRIFMPLRQASNWSPPNVWFLLNAFSGGVLPYNNSAISLISIALVALMGCIYFFYHRRALAGSLTAHAAGWVYVFGLFMVLSPKSLGNYVAIFLIPLTFLTVRHKDRLAFWLVWALSILASIQPSLWFRIGQPTHANFTYLHSIPELVELAMEVGMIIVLIGLLQRTWIWADAENPREGVREPDEIKSFAQRPLNMAR